MLIHLGDYDSGWDAGYEAYHLWRETGGAQPARDAGDSFGAGWLAGWDAAAIERSAPGPVQAG